LRPPLSLLGLFGALVIVPELAGQGSAWLFSIFLWLAPGPILLAIAASDVASAQLLSRVQAIEAEGRGTATCSVRAANSQLPSESDE
jgi:hypothetical protein